MIFPYLPPESWPVTDVRQSLHVKGDPRLFQEAQLKSTDEGNGIHRRLQNETGTTRQLDITEKFQSSLKEMIEIVCTVHFFVN